MGDNAGTGASAGSGGIAGAGDAGGNKADPGPPDVACNPADKTADPKPATTTQTGMPPTGPYKVTVEVDPSLPKQTEIRPELKEGVKYPIIAWGNTACSDNSLLFPEFLPEIASHGFLIIDAGTPNGTGSVPQDATYMTQAIDWAFKENERPCSQYYHKLDTTKVAAMGQSCGGLMTYAVAGDPRLTTIILWDSGNLSNDSTIYDKLHTSVAFFYGGTSDVAFNSAEADFDKITKDIAVFSGHQNQYGHYTTIDQDNGGEYAQVGVAWLRWQLMDDQGPTGKQMFAGANCGICRAPWVIRQKNIN